ncbi:Na+/H+ antiporter subunit E [Phycisphaerales bacterium AB-hyl4]|uniref:Na+/H+ antiporter subunit E n=1 Tax=Natronomicrosphaera hydrolytica TaxID=3242702 RepID=A0ABV4U9A5_9BACT
MTWLFLLNLFMAILYIALVGDPSAFTFVVGFLLGALVITLYCRVSKTGSYPGKVWRLIRFVGFFTRILIIANLQVAWEVLSPKHTMTPRILRYSVQGMTPAQITTLANTISLTPGTLTADIDDDGQHLYIHGMYCRDRDAALRDLDEIKRRLMNEVFET